MTGILLAFVIFFSFCATPGDAFGQVYKQVDEKGTVHFSDNPTSGVFSPSQKPTSKENSTEIIKGIEMGNRHISRDEMLLYHQNRGTEEVTNGKKLKALKEINEQNEGASRELQKKRDAAADKLEREARKPIYDHKGNPLPGMTKGQREMLINAERLRLGLDPQISPPLSDEAQKWKKRARDAEFDAHPPECGVDRKHSKHE